MNIRLNARTVCLTRTQALTLDDARGSSIRCHAGRVWITQNGDPRDIVLVSGESFTLDRDSPAIVTAIRDASIEVSPVPVSSNAQRPVAHLWHLARAALGGLARGAAAVATVH